MRITDFDVYRDLLRERSGLVITPEKSYLLDSRLGPIAKKWGYPSLEAMTLALQGVPDRQLVNDVVEAMSDHDTSFFRDVGPFEAFQDWVVPHLLQRSGRIKKIRIWCAAVSTGQEAYSLAMTLKENEARLQGLKIEIFGTDISSEVIEQARQGAYSQLEVQRGLPVKFLLKYFNQDGKKWQISPALNKMVRFETHNLLDNPSSFGKFDVIFCRNALHHFDHATRQKILERIDQSLEKDGFLFLGHDEKVDEALDRFKPAAGDYDIYIKSDSAPLAPLQKEAPGKSKKREALA